MKVRLLIALAAACAAQCLEAAPRTLTPVPIDSQQLVYSHGQAFVFSEGRDTALQLSTESVDSRRVWLIMSFTNLGQSPALVSENPVRARALTSEGEASSRIITGTELEQREKRRQMWENIGAGVASGLNAYNASQQGYGTATTTHRGTVTGRSSQSGYIRGNYSGTSTTRYYDPVAAQAANAEAAANNQRMFDSLRNDQDLRSSALASAVLKTHTLGSGETYSGRLQIELPRKQRDRGILLSLEVRLGEEVHPFLVLVDGNVASNVMQTARQGAERVLSRLRPDSASPTAPEDSSSERIIAQSEGVEGNIDPPRDLIQDEPRRSHPEAPPSMAARNGGVSSASTSVGAPSSSGFGATPAEDTGSIPSPIRIALNDADYTEVLKVEAELVQAGKKESLIDMTIRSTAKQERNGDSVQHEVTIDSAQIGAEQNASQVEDFLTGLLFEYETTTYGQPKGSSQVKTRDGQSATISVDEALDGSRLRFATTPASIGDIAATSAIVPKNQRNGPSSALAAFLGDVVEWRLTGATVRSGRESYMLTARSSSSAEIASAGESESLKTSVEGLSIVDAASGVVIHQEINASVEIQERSASKSEVRVRVTRQATLGNRQEESGWEPYLTKITTTSIRRDDGSIADQLFLDLRWIAKGAPQASSGRLLIRHIEVGQTVSLPWQIPPTVIQASGGADIGFGFDVSALGEASKWLPSASLQQLEVSFQPDN
jgi:hypothetical protein